MTTILFPKQAQFDAVRQRLEAVRAKNATGLLTPEAVVDDARDPESPYHDRFEWDDAKAAQRHRLDTARALIRSVRVQVRTEREVVSTVAYVRDPSLEPAAPGYRPVAELRTKRDLAVAALEREMASALAALTRAKEVAAGLDLEEEVSALMSEAVSIREKLAAVA